MSETIELTDGFAAEARIAAAAMDRTIASQVEFWARLGMSLDRIMNDGQFSRKPEPGQAARLSHILETIDKPEGRARLKAYLESRPKPHFLAHPELAGVMVKIDVDDSRVAGRFMNRQFIPLTIEELAGNKELGSYEVLKVL